MSDETIITPADLLPHRPPMLLVNAVTDVGTDYAESLCTIGEDMRLFRRPDGTYGAWMIIELMAQTIGLWSGMSERRAGGKPKVGFLLGTRNLTCSRAFFRDGEKIKITVKSACLAMDGDFPSQFECTAAIDDGEIAKANLTVYQPKDLSQWKN